MTARDGTGGGGQDGLLDLLAEFLDEAEASLLGIEPAILRLERRPDDLVALAEAFRLVHTFKGTGGFLGLTRLSTLAHATEEVLDRLRRDAMTGVAARAGAAGPILAALDRLALLLRQIRAVGREPAGDDDDVLAALSEPGRPGAPITAIDAPAPAPAASGYDRHAGVSAIRVAVPVMERMLAAVGELVLARNQLVFHAERVAGAAQDGDATLGLLAQRIGGITGELQAAVLRARMQPIGQAWATLPRLVRDLSVKLGKRIEFETSGTEVELDRQVLELLRDPLIHMVRNSCDHGIETPEARAAAGKPAIGRITLAARPNGASVVVTLRDDGRGIDVAKLRARAQADGVLTEAEAAAISDAQATMLAFHPGMSTAGAVTAVSGRGVGMDVVKTNIERIGGTVALESASGRGTTLTLTLPLTLAIMPALMVSTCGQRFALPQAAVAEIVRAPVGAASVGPASVERDVAVIEVRDGVPRLRWREASIPLVELSAALDLTPAAAGAGSSWEPSDTAVRHVVVVRAGPLAYGLAVDPVFNVKDVVVTPLCSLLRGVAAFGGTTITADGSLALVLDVVGIARLAGIDATPVYTPVPTRAEEDDAAASAIPLLLFAATGRKMAAPLALIVRLEQVDGAAIAAVEDDAAPLTLRLGKRLLPTRDLRARPTPACSAVAALIMGNAEHADGRCAALLVDAFEDIVTETLRLCDDGARAGELGTAELAGATRAVLDVPHWLKRIDPAWADPPPPHQQQHDLSESEVETNVETGVEMGGCALAAMSRDDRGRGAAAA